MRDLWVSMFEVFWVLFGVVVLGGVFLASGFHCVCVCVCARARGLAWRMYASVRDTPSLSTMRLAITGSEGLWKTSDG